MPIPTSPTMYDAIMSSLGQQPTRGTGTSTFGAAPIAPPQGVNAGDINSQFIRQFGVNPAEFEAGLTAEEIAAAKARTAAIQAANTVPEAAGRRAVMTITPEMAAEMAARQGFLPRALGALGTAGRAIAPVARIAGSAPAIGAQVLLTPDIAGAPERPLEVMPAGLAAANMQALEDYFGGKTPEVPIAPAPVPEDPTQWNKPTKEPGAPAWTETFAKAARAGRGETKASRRRKVERIKARRKKKAGAYINKQIEGIKKAGKE
jgi:hypothetical protein